MLRSWIGYYWKVNSNEVMGYAPGTLIIVDGQGGGGFAGEAIKLVPVLYPAAVINAGDPMPEPIEFPQPSSSTQYLLGGREWGSYIYYNKEIARIREEHRGG